MKKMICIVCPRGCHLTIDEDLNIHGNHCNRGHDYALKELVAPKRNISSTVKVINGKNPVCSVKTSKEIDKKLIFEVMAEINKVKVQAPIKIHDVIIKNVLNTDVDIIATSNVEKGDIYR